MKYKWVEFEAWQAGIGMWVELVPQPVEQTAGEAAGTEGMAVGFVPGSLLEAAAVVAVLVLSPEFGVFVAYIVPHAARPGSAEDKM